MEENNDYLFKYDQRNILKIVDNILKDYPICDVASKGTAYSFFLQGVEWTIENLWHTIDQKPWDHTNILIETEFDDEEKRFELAYTETNFEFEQYHKRWIYINDIYGPDKFFFKCR